MASFTSPKTILFPDVLKRWSFQKNRAGIWSFLYYRERSCFFFPKIWSYTLGGKWKMIFPKKIHGNMIFSSSFLKRWSFQKEPHQEMTFLVLSGILVFFFPKTRYFFLGQEVRDDLSQERHENMIFSVYTYGCYKRSVTPLCQKKNQRWSYPAKIHLKVIDVLDWHPRKSSSNSLYFHGDLYRRFHVLLSSEKKNRKLNI